VDALFPWYWRLLGLPLSRLKGVFVDRVPFSLVEILIWAGIACTIVLAALLAAGRRPWLKRRPALAILLIAGPALLVFMGLGQGAFPYSLAPTAWRQPLAEAFPAPSVAYGDFRRELDRREIRLLETFSAAYYQSLSEAEILAGCDRALDGVLASLGLPPGRTVRKIKPMGPLTTVLGLSYGGPAFHDPFFGEMAMVRPEDYPAPRYWRLMGVCHEVAHAKGFTREMDAEILTQLALSRSADPRYRMLGDIMFLRKAGERIRFPEYLRREILAARAGREKVDSGQHVIRYMRETARKLGFQNTGGKYGSRDPEEDWNPDHPFYATIIHLLSLPAAADGRHAE